MAPTVLSSLVCAAALVVAVPLVRGQGEHKLDPGQNWLSWRGPQQNGTSLERGLPATLASDGPGSWTLNIAGRGTPVIAGDRVYCLGYSGEGKELQERLLCLDAATGRILWEHRFSDFLTDVIYYRFSLGSPTIDPETGNVYHLSTAGLLSCFTADGKLVWQRAMMSEYGRLTFPNGRTGAPLVDGDLVIVHVISTSWGKYAPARDRFYAFDKKRGVCVWSCTPGGRPRDSSFSFPVVTTENGRRVLYAGLGGGNLVCVDVRTGDPVWKFQMSIGGINSSALLYKDRVIAVHGRENLDNSTIGRMVALRRVQTVKPGAPELKLDAKSEIWRNDLAVFTSSPVLVDNRVYVTVHTGELCSVDADTGKVLWQEKLAPDQIHASPAWCDGRLYVPMNNGKFFVIRPTDAGAERLQELDLEGNCLAAPAIAHGRVYVHTTEKLYCFGGGRAPARPAKVTRVASQPAVGAAVRLQVVPADAVLHLGMQRRFTVRSLDANGRIKDPQIPSADLEWQGLPPGTRMAAGTLDIPAEAAPWAGVIRVRSGALGATARVRIVRAAPYLLDFEHTSLRPHPRQKGVLFAHPPRYWVGAMKKWEVRKLGDSNVLAKTIAIPLFQRTMSFIGYPEMSNYTIQADILSDGNRRTMSTAGLVNQRFLVTLKGNYQRLEITSNVELLKESVKFRWKPKTWYRLKTRVDVSKDGSGWIRAKAWPRAEDEPEKWTLEVAYPHMHTHGAPGIYGFAPQSRFRVYLDNISVTPND